MKEYSLEDLAQIEEMATILTSCTCDNKCDMCDYQKHTTADYACIDFAGACRLFNHDFRKVHTDADKQDC